MQPAPRRGPPQGPGRGSAGRVRRGLLPAPAPEVLLGLHRELPRPHPRHRPRHHRALRGRPREPRHALALVDRPAAREARERAAEVVLRADHPARVDSSRTTITLPEGVAPQQFTGTTDYLVAAYLNDVQTNDVLTDVTEGGRVITFDTQRAIMPGEKLDVRVQIPHGVLPIATPTLPAKSEFMW